MRLHVVHVVHSLGVGGTENGMLGLINALRGDFRHTIVSMTNVAPLADRLPADAELHCLDQRPGLDWRAFARLTRLLRRLRPHTVHSRNWGAFDAVAAARLVGVPGVIHGEHGREASDPRGLNRRRNALRRWLAPGIDRFVTVSRDLGGWLRETVGIRREKVVVIPNGVDTERFCGAGGETVRRALGLAADCIVVGTVGRLDPVKGQLTLMDAFAQLHGREQCRLLVVGDGPCRAALEARARHRALAGRVSLLGERRDVPALLRAMDIFVLPSIAEGMSNTVLEAMATGLPVVATRTGGNPELVEDGVTGRLVPVADPAALAEGIGAYVVDASLRTGHGQAGRRRAREEFSLAHMVARYRALYQAIADEKAA